MTAKDTNRGFVESPDDWYQLCPIKLNDWNQLCPIKLTLSCIIIGFLGKMVQKPPEETVCICSADTSLCHALTQVV